MTKNVFIVTNDEANRPKIIEESVSSLVVDHINVNLRYLLVGGKSLVVSVSKADFPEYPIMCDSEEEARTFLIECMGGIKSLSGEIFHVGERAFYVHLIQSYRYSDFSFIYYEVMDTYMEREVDIEFSYCFHHRDDADKKCKELNDEAKKNIEDELSDVEYWLWKRDITPVKNKINGERYLVAKIKNNFDLEYYYILYDKQSNEYDDFYFFNTLGNLMFDGGLVKRYIQLKTTLKYDNCD